MQVHRLSAPEGKPEDIVMELFNSYLDDFDFDEALMHLRTLGLRRPDLLRRLVDALETLVADPPTDDWTLLTLVEYGANTSLDDATEAAALVWIRNFADTYIRPMTRELEREGRLPPAGETAVVSRRGTTPRRPILAGLDDNPIDDPGVTAEELVADLFWTYLRDRDHDEAMTQLRDLGTHHPDAFRRYTDALETLVADPPTETGILLPLVQRVAQIELDDATDAGALAWIRDLADTHLRPLTRELERQGQLPRV